MPDDGSATGLLRIGRVGRPHGTDGSFTVSEPTARLELLDPGRMLIVGGTEMRVKARGGTAAHPRLNLVGIDSRAAAEALRGAEIHVPRAAVAVPDGEFLVDDLLGCAVVDGPDRVGTVSDVLLLPAADVLEVARPAGEPLLVPLVGDAVRCVDVPGRRIDIDVGFLGELAD